MGLSGRDRGLYGVSHSLSPLLALWGGAGGRGVMGGGLHVSGKVERVALQLGKGDGRMLQVVEQHLDLRTHSRQLSVGFV